jgi:hypothetical protein
MSLAISVVQAAYRLLTSAACKVNATRSLKDEVALVHATSYNMTAYVVVVTESTPPVASLFDIC